MYDAEFYVEEGRVARESAIVVAAWMHDEHLCLYSGRIIDIGCGTGEWARAFQTYDNTVLGIDLYAPIMPYIPSLRLDITGGIDCTGWDLAICLEVAEHLPKSAAAPLVDGLAKAGMVLFSAATPGQPGVGHINCQPHDYWHRHFANAGYTPTHVGPLFDGQIADFYVRNMYLYTRESS